MENRKQFEKNAPLIEPYKFGQYIRETVIKDDFESCKIDIFLFGSMANPAVSIDRNEHLSDIDVFIVVDGWSGPIADVGIFLFASETETPQSFDDYCDKHNWGAADLQDREWECNVDEAWERISRPTQALLERSAQIAVFRNKKERQTGLARTVDLFIGSKHQFNRTSEPDARLHVWPSKQAD